MGNAVVSADQWVLWGEQSNAESLPLHHPTGHACMIAASCVQIFLNDLEGQNQFSIGRKEGCEGSSLTTKSLNKSHPILPLKGAFSTPSLGGRGEAGAVQSESRVLDEKQAEEEPAVRPGRVHRDSVLHMGRPATSQISDTRVPHCPSIKWQLREWSEETLLPFSRTSAGEEEGSEMGAWVLKRMA